MAEKKPKPQARHLFVASDATGETAEKVVNAALSQFGKPNLLVTRHTDIRTEAQVISLIDEAASKEALVVYTIISPQLRTLLHRRAVRLKVGAIDLMGNLLTHLAAHLHRSPLSQPGLLHKIDADYFRRIDAVDFAVKHDDGQSPQTLHEADIVLVGVSRTTKTPLSIYLARDGWKVANVPLVYGIEPPAELFTINQRRIFGLTIDPQRLAHIRKARLRHLPVRVGMALEYADMDYILKETAYSKELFAQHPGWRILDVTGRAVEEVANDVLGALKANALDDH
ncbi:MAG: pyruvate, water dikinase regulatory protein [Nitrospirota bacterium]